MSALILQMTLYLPPAFILFWSGGWKVKLSSILMGAWAVLSGAVAVDLLPTVQGWFR